MCYQFISILHKFILNTWHTRAYYCVFLNDLNKVSNPGIFNKTRPKFKKNDKIYQTLGLFLNLTFWSTTWICRNIAIVTINVVVFWNDLKKVVFHKSGLKGTESFKNRVHFRICRKVMTTWICKNISTSLMISRNYVYLGFSIA